MLLHSKLIPISMQFDHQAESLLNISDVLWPKSLLINQGLKDR